MQLHMSVSVRLTRDILSALGDPGSPYYSRVDASPEAGDALSPPDLEKVVTKAQSITSRLHADFEL